MRGKKTKKLTIVCAVAAFTALALAVAHCEEASAPAKAPGSAYSAKIDQSPIAAPNTLKHLDIPFGPAPLQKLDVYSPKGVSNAPVVIFVHGGEWAKNDKSMVSYKPKFFNENGIVFISTNYRLTPPDVHPAHVNDVADAVAWTHKHIAEYSGSPNKIFLMGHSAGCHLVTLVGLDPRPLARDGLKPSVLRGVVAWSGGAYDLVQKVHDAGMYADYIRKTFGDKESGWKDASPVYHVTDTRPLPPFLFISVEKGNRSQLAAERLANLIRGAGGKADTALLQDRNHMTAIHLIGAPGDTTGRILLDFINRKD